MIPKTCGDLETERQFEAGWSGFGPKRPDGVMEVFILASSKRIDSIPLADFGPPISCLHYAVFWRKR
jgi:hypothetical protein